MAEIRRRALRVVVTKETGTDREGLIALAMDSEGILRDLRKTFYSGKTRHMNWKKKQLQSLINLIVQNEEEILESLHSDLGKPRCEGYRDEVALAEKSARNALKCLHKWMAPTKVSVPLVAYRGSAEVLPEPLGVVLIFSAWNFPLSLAIEPLIGAIAAGNAVVLKPSELAPATSALLAKLIPKYLDNGAVRVVEGGPKVCNKLLEHKWDKIFFTGSSRIARIVMLAAAKHLTPVTLELGGKCPTVVDSINNKKELVVTSNRIAFGKWAVGNGQACLAPDYILVQEDFAPKLIDYLKKRIEKFFGEDPSKSSDLSKIVNVNHFRRLTTYLQDPSVAKTIVYGGRYDEKRLYIQPTLLLNPSLSSDVMNDEIFGPLLPIITLKNIEDSIEFVNLRPRPLGIYIFSNNKALTERFVSETSSGSITVNDCIVQYALDGLPFGGVGESGFGNYHGKYSFDTFSHQRALLYRGFFPEMFFRYPPWNGFKLSLLRSALTFNYLRLILVLLGLKK